MTYVSFPTYNRNLKSDILRIMYFQKQLIWVRTNFLTKNVKTKLEIHQREIARRLLGIYYSQIRKPKFCIAHKIKFENIAKRIGMLCA